MGDAKLPTICNAVKLTVCSGHHVHLEMICDGQPLTEVVYTADEAMGLRDLLENAIDAAVGI